jgi:hypothetical protein
MKSRKEGEQAQHRHQVGIASKEMVRMGEAQVVAAKVRREIRQERMETNNSRVKSKS